MNTVVVMQFRETLDSEVEDEGAIAMTLDERFPYPWTDSEVEDAFHLSDGGKLYFLADGAAGTEWGKYAVKSPETPASTWVVLPEIPSRYEGDIDE